MSTHNITIQSGASARLPTAGKYCDRDIIVTADGGISMTLPIYTAIVTDNDGADITITAMVNEGGKLVWKSTTVPSCGSTTITCAMYTPIFIYCKYVPQPPVVYDGDHDILNCPTHFDATNDTFVVFPQINGGSEYFIDVFL